MAKGFRSNDTWRRTGYTGRTISHIKVGDVIKCFRNVEAEFSVGKRRNYYKDDWYKDGTASTIRQRRNVLSCRLLVTGVYDHYILVKDMDKARDDTLCMGDLVLLGLEPGFEGYDKKVHEIKPPVPMQLKGRW